MSAKFSPGPWRWNVGSDCCNHLKDAARADVLEGQEHVGVLAANERLIAAAPEMYELLQVAICGTAKDDPTRLQVEALLARIDGP